MSGVPVNHLAIYPGDLDASLRFYVAGVGLEVLFDVTLDVDLEAFIGEQTSRVRTIFLGDKASPDVGALELIDFGKPEVAEQPAGLGRPQRGAFLVSFHTPVAAALQRLADLGLGGTPRSMPARGGGLAATVVDPDGIVVELLDDPVSFA